MSFVLGTAGVKRATVSETSVGLSGFFSTMLLFKDQHLFLVVVSLMQSLMCIKMLWVK